MSYWVAVEISGVSRKFVVTNFKTDYPIASASDITICWLPGNKDNAHQILIKEMATEAIQALSQSPVQVINDIIEQCGNRNEIGYGHKQLTFKVMASGDYSVLASIVVECDLGKDPLSNTLIGDTPFSIEDRLSRLSKLVDTHKGFINLNYLAVPGQWRINISCPTGECVTRYDTRLESVLGHIEGVFDLKEQVGGYDTGILYKGSVRDASWLPLAEDSEEHDAWLTEDDKKMFVLTNGQWNGPLEFGGNRN